MAEGELWADGEVGKVGVPSARARYAFFTDAPMVAGIDGDAEMPSEVIGDAGTSSARIRVHAAGYWNQSCGRTPCTSAPGYQNEYPP